MAGLDTPDNTRGIISAQILLGSFDGTVATATVGVPPSAETIVVVCGEGGSLAGVDGRGVQSGTGYLGVSSTNADGSGSSTVWYLDVSSVVDQAVEITVANTFERTWYVYADAAAHFSVTPQPPSNNEGVPYVIPTIPSGRAADGPANEVTVLQYSSSVSANVLPVPLTAQYYRLYSVDLILTAGTAACSLNDVPAGVSYAFAIGTTKSSLTLPAQGARMATRSPLFLTVSGGGTTALATIAYTLET